MNTQELTKLADDAYYAADYPKAIQLYRQILEQAPKNKNARTQLEKAELNLSLQTTIPEVPVAAIKLYKRSRSFITAGDLTQAKKLLKEAISTAQKAGTIFPLAQELLDNLSNASTADSFSQRAMEQLHLKEWSNAVLNLETATNLDQTNETITILLSHLQSLIKAQNLVSQLNSGIKDYKKRMETITEIQKIIDDTNKLPVLSPLWQDVVRQFGEYDNRENQSNNIIKNLIWSSLGAILLIIGSLWLLYLLPHTRPIVDCSQINGLKVSLNYPNYIANGDKETVALTIKNTGSDPINGQVLLDFHGTAKVQFENSGANKIKIDDLDPSEQKSANVEFSLNEPFRLISDPSRYIEYNLHMDGNNSNCNSTNYHIAVSPIYGLRKVVAGLWSLVGLTLFGLFKDRIISFLFHRA